MEETCSALNPSHFDTLDIEDIVAKSDSDTPAPKEITTEHWYFYFILLQAREVERMEVRVSHRLNVSGPTVRMVSTMSLHSCSLRIYQQKQGQNLC